MNSSGTSLFNIGVLREKGQYFLLRKKVEKP